LAFLTLPATFSSDRWWAANGFSVSAGELQPAFPKPPAAIPTSFPKGQNENLKKVDTTQADLFRNASCSSHERLKKTCLQFLSVALETH
jgi:hypothetical protein